MPVLKNSQHELFVQKWHETGNKSEALRYSNPRAKNWTPGTVNSRASELSKNSEVLVRFKELQNKASEKHEVTIDSLIEELTENRRIALEAETPQASAANASTMGKARLCGLDTQKIEHNLSDDFQSLLDDASE